MDFDNGNGGAADALPPSPLVPEDVVPIKAELVPAKKKVMRVPMARRGLGTKGQKAQLLTNHFKVNVSNVEGHFFHYSVALFYEDGRPIVGKGVGRRLLDKVHETYGSELAGKEFAYDGEKSLFTLGAFQETSSSSPLFWKTPLQIETMEVQAIAQALRGQESESSQEALRVLDIILRQHAARQGCLLVRHSFFRNDPKNFADVGGGVLGCRGFHSSFRTSQGGLSLNINVSTTMIVHEIGIPKAFKPS
nr:protein argonaute 4-like [Tanacetum cinerariifolium]